MRVQREQPRQTGLETCHVRLTREHPRAVDDHPALGSIQIMSTQRAASVECASDRMISV